MRLIYTAPVLGLLACWAPTTPDPVDLQFVAQPEGYQPPPGSGQLQISGPTSVTVAEDAIWTVTASDLAVGVSVSLGWGGQEQPGRCLHRQLIGGWLCLDIGGPVRHVRHVVTTEHPNIPGQGIATFDLTVPGTPRSHVFLQAISVQGADSATTPPLRVDIQRPSGFQSCACPSGFAARPANDGCVRVTESAPTTNPTQYEVCDIVPSTAYGWRGGELPGGTRLTAPFFFDASNGNNHRLDRVGVWACPSNDTGWHSGFSGSSEGDPSGEWIGFSTCVDLAQPGLYMLGIAGDNNVRLHVDGELVYQNLDSSQAPFNSWWLVPVQLGSGDHDVELEGLNNGGPAGFGAEIYGPYPANTPLDDVSLAALDYENNLVWTSDTATGQTFNLGEGSGSSCPSGQALHTCGGPTVCVLVEEADCL